MKSHPKGDTLIEVMFAVGIFGAVAIGAIGIMNRGLYNTQKTLEITMARQEIDAQAEALRFIHEAYISEQNLPSAQQIYTPLWQKLSDQLISTPENATASFFNNYNNRNCTQLYSNRYILTDKSFVINIRRLSATGIATAGTNPIGTTSSKVLIKHNRTNPSNSVLSQSSTHPRLLFTASDNINLSDRDISETTGTEITTFNTTLVKAQGIWINGIASDNTANPEFYDFYIRTCWFAPGSPNSITISTTIRLFNPDYR